MNAKVAILLALVAVVAADSDEFRGYRAPSRSFESHSFESGSFESYESSEPRYNFQWSVNHGRNDYGHQEGRDGDDTKGSYYAQLPDGRLQKVEYVVNGGSGYIADVQYTGSASFESGSDSGYSASDESFRYYGSNSDESK